MNPVRPHAASHKADVALPSMTMEGLWGVAA